jgi:hypothetical protein
VEPGGVTVPDQGRRAGRRRRGARVLAWFSALGRVLRFIAGVDESLMDKVRWERTWYTSLGGVVLGTATIAAFSMWFALGEAAAANPWGALVPAGIWFVFIVILDRWIVSTRSTDAWQKLMLLVTRGLLAVLFGVVIAEPLVLRVFQTQIEAQIRHERAVNLDSLRSDLITCNPDPADPAAEPAPQSCGKDNLVLSLPATSAPELRQLTDLKAQADALAKTIAADSAMLDALNKRTADECAGNSGHGLTGKPGDGPACRKDQANAAQFIATHPLQAQQRQLAELQAKISQLQESMKLTQGTFTEQRAARITERLADEPQVADDIGLLERMSALSTLGAANLTLGFGIILVRMLFITIDCAPVLMKVASGSTFYDKMVLSSLQDAVKTHGLSLESNDSEREMVREEQEQDKRDHKIRMEQRLADAVDARAALYESQAMDDGFEGTVR